VKYNTLHFKVWEYCFYSLAEVQNLPRKSKISPTGTIILLRGKIVFQKVCPATNKFSEISPTGWSRTRVDSAPLIAIFDIYSKVKMTYAIKMYIYIYVCFFVSLMFDYVITNCLKKEERKKETESYNIYKSHVFLYVRMKIRIL